MVNAEGISLVSLISHGISLDSPVVQRFSPSYSEISRELFYSSEIEIIENIILDSILTVLYNSNSEIEKLKDMDSEINDIFVVDSEIDLEDWQ